MKSPTAASQPGASVRSSSAVADAGVEPGIGDVDEEVDEQEDGGDQHDERLGERVVAARDRLDEQHAQAVQVEHLLGDYQPAEQEGEFQADHGEHRKNGVLERVAREDELEP